MRMSILTKLRSSYWLKSGSFTFATKIVESGIGLLTFLVLVRTMTVNQFGIWVLFISVSAMIESMRKAFVYNPIVKFLNTSNESEYDFYITASIVQNSLYTLISSIFIVLLSYPLSIIWEAPEIKNVLYVFAISNLFVGFFAQTNFIQQSNLNFKGPFFAILFRKGLFFAFSLFCFFFYKEVSVSALVLSQIVIFILIIPLNLWFVKAYVNNMNWDIQSFYRLLNFGKFTIGTNLSSMVFQSVDSWLLGSLVTVQAVALYNPAIRILALIEIPIVSLSIITYPQLAKRFKGSSLEGIKNLYEKSLGVLLAFIIPICAITILFSEQIIVLMAGKEYLESADLLKVTILFGLFIPFNRQLGITLNAIGKAKVNMIFVMVNLSINILFNYICIKYFGIIGAAYGTLLAYVLSLIYGQLLGYYMFKTSSLNVLKNIIKVLCSPLTIFKSQNHV